MMKPSAFSLLSQSLRLLVDEKSLAQADQEVVLFKTGVLLGKIKQQAEACCLKGVEKNGAFKQ